MAEGNGKQAPGYLDQHMLIAMPGMVDDNFVGSVTLLCQHNEAGAIGITINRESAFTLGESDSVRLDSRPTFRMTPFGRLRP